MMMMTMTMMMMMMMMMMRRSSNLGPSPGLEGFNRGSPPGCVGDTLLACRAPFRLPGLP